jgi:hypothetical protein
MALGIGVELLQCIISLKFVGHDVIFLSLKPVKNHLIV